MFGDMEEADDLLGGRHLDDALNDDAELDLEASLDHDEDFISGDTYKNTASRLLSQGSRVPASLLLLIVSTLVRSVRWGLSQVGIRSSADERRQAKLSRRPVITSSLTDRHWVIDYVSHRPWLSGLLWTTGGALLGLVAAVVVNATLIEITVNGFFALYFGVLFLLIACLLLYNNLGSALGTSEDGTQSRTGLWVVRGFALMLLVSSGLCFATEQQWWAQEAWTWAEKIPPYALLGASTCFVLSIAAVDVVNLFLNVFRTESQLYLLAAASTIAGFLFGAIFAIVDVEDAPNSIEMQKALSMSEAFCFPIGLLLGALAGRINQSLLD